MNDLRYSNRAVSNSNKTVTVFIMLRSLSETIIRDNNMYFNFIGLFYCFLYSPWRWLPFFCSSTFLTKCTPTLQTLDLEASKGGFYSCCILKTKQKLQSTFECSRKIQLCINCWLFIILNFISINYFLSMQDRINLFINVKLFEHS